MKEIIDDLEKKLSTCSLTPDERLEFELKIAQLIALDNLNDTLENMLNLFKWAKVFK